MRNGFFCGKLAALLSGCIITLAPPRGFSVEKSSHSYRPAFILERAWTHSAATAPNTVPQFSDVLDIGFPYSLFMSTKDPSGLITQRAAVNLTAIARNQWTASRASRSGVADRIVALHNAEIAGDVNSEPFPVEMQSVLFWSSIASGRKLSLIASPPYFEKFIGSLSALEDMKRLAHRLVAEAYWPAPAFTATGTNLAFADFVFALGRAAGLPVWAGGFSNYLPAGAFHNLALYRAAQYAPEGFFIPEHLAGSSELPALRNEIQEINQLINQAQEPGYQKPTANIALCADPTEIPLAEILDPILNALLADGYQTRVSFGELPPADLHYILYDPRWDKRGVMDGIARLLDRRVSKFTGAVIFHPLGEIESGGAWKDIRTHFKIPRTEKGWMPMPRIAHSNGLKIPWDGKLNKEFKTGMTRISAQRVKWIGGDPVLTHMSEGQTLALILSSGKDYFINGNLLHFQSAQILSRLMNGALLSPTSAYVTQAPAMLAAISPVETEVKIKLLPPPIKERRLILFEANGKKAKDENVAASDIFESKLRPWELLLLIGR